MTDTAASLDMKRFHELLMFEGWNQRPSVALNGWRLTMNAVTPTEAQVQSAARRRLDEKRGVAMTTE